MTAHDSPPRPAPAAIPSAATVAAAWRRTTKRYRQHLALDALDLELRVGEITALLGPNGAGKTTAVRLLLGLTRPTSGAVAIFGAPPQDAAVRQRVGAMLQVARVPDTLTIEEHVRLFSSYYPAPRPLDEVLATIGLGAERRCRFGNLSGGQRQRLLFGLALCGDPDLLVLDEPTVGMDADARRGLWTVVRDARARGRAVLLTTHYLEEADALADRVVMLQRGRVVADGTPTQIKGRTRSRTLRCRTSLEAHLLRALPGVREVVAGPPRAWLVCDDADAAARSLLLADANAGDVEIAASSLEEAFLALTADAPGATPMESTR